MQDIEQELGGQAFWRKIYTITEISRERRRERIDSEEILAYASPDGNVTTVLNGAFSFGEDSARFTIIHEAIHIWDIRRGLDLTLGPEGHFQAIEGECLIGTSCGWGAYRTPTEPNSLFHRPSPAHWVRAAAKYNIHYLKPSFLDA